MSRVRIVLSRLAGLLRGRRIDRDFAQEVASHLDEAAEEYRVQGLSPDEARRAALRAFGGIARTTDAYRETRAPLVFAWLWRDVRIGVRVLRGSSGSTAVAVLTLALGIGVSTLFSVVYGVWLHAYPYRDIDGILYPRAKATDGSFADSQNGVFRQREFLEFARVPAVADAMANSFYDYVTLAGDDGPQQVSSIGMSARAFSFLGVSPLLGRTLEPFDFRPNGALACYLPARHAKRVDLLTVLRTD